MPPGMLDLLAITDCDDGAMRDMRIEEDPDDSTMVKRTALETKGWTGFNSSQL
jgi:hypothetical protein